MEYSWDSHDRPEKSADWIFTNEALYPKLFQKLGLAPGDVKDLFDGGSGYGGSVLVAGRYFNKSQLYSCSVGETPTQEIRQELGDRLHFTEQEIKPYLKGNSREYDLVILAFVPTNGITSPDDYKLLAERVKKNGFVLDLGDTGLTPWQMQKYFEQVDAGETGLWVKAWRKKS